MATDYSKETMHQLVQESAYFGFLKLIRDGKVNLLALSYPPTNDSILPERR